MTKDKCLDNSMKQFREVHKYYLNEYGAHELRFTYGVAFSGVYSACFTFSFPRSGADKKHSENFNKMVDDFRNKFNYEECKQNGAHWDAIRDEICYNFINPSIKQETILCSTDKFNWVNIETMKNNLKLENFDFIHIRYVSSTKHKDILSNISLVDCINESIMNKYGYDGYISYDNEKEIIQILSKYLNANCLSNIDSVFEKTVSSEYFLENY